MDIWTAVQRVLEKNPGLRAKFLIPKLEEKTGLARSTINEHLTTFAARGDIYREKGRYWLKKPEQRGFEDILSILRKSEPRIVRKDAMTEKERKLLSLDAEGYALIEEAMLEEHEWTPERVAKIRQKYREIFGLA